VGSEDCTSDEKSGRKRIKKLEVMVADVIQETHDSTTLVFFTGNDRLDYKPGHFLTIDPHQFSALERFTAYLEDTKERKETARAYSLYSAPHERYLAITVKEERYVSGSTEYPPLLSPLLVRRTPVGARMVVTGFTGPYTLPDDIEERTDHLVHICAGSGSVPNLSILKHCLETGMNLRHTFIYGNKLWEDVIFADKLAELQGAHPDNLEVFHSLTREEDPGRYGDNVRSGRINESMIRELVNDPGAAEFFVCGPGITKWDKKRAKAEGEDPRPRFLESALEALSAMGIDKKKVHNESYG